MMRKDVTWPERTRVTRNKAMYSQKSLPLPGRVPVRVPAVTNKTKPIPKKTSLSVRRYFFIYNVIFMLIMLVILHILLLGTVLPTLKFILVTHSSLDRSLFITYEIIPIVILVITSILLLYSLRMSSHKWPRLQLIIFAAFSLQMFYVILFCILFAATIYIDYGLCRWDPYIKLFKPMYDILTAAILNRLMNLENARRALKSEERLKLGYPDYKNITKISMNEVDKWDHISPELSSLNCQYTFALFCCATALNAIVVFLWSYFIVLAAKGIYIKPIEQCKNVQLITCRINENKGRDVAAAKRMGDNRVKQDKGCINRGNVVGGSMMAYNVQVPDIVQRTKSLCSCPLGELVPDFVNEVGNPNLQKVEYRMVSQKEPLLPFIISGAEFKVALRKRFSSIDSLTVFVDSDIDSLQRSEVVVSSYHTSSSTARSKAHARTAKESNASSCHSGKSYTITDFLQDFYSFFRAKRQQEREAKRKLSKTQLFQIPKTINKYSANCLESTSAAESLLKTKRFFKQMTLNSALSLEIKDASDEDDSSLRSYTSHLGLGPSMKRSNRVRPAQICGMCNGILRPGPCERPVSDSESSYYGGAYDSEGIFCNCINLEQFRRLSNEFQKKRQPQVEFQNI